MPGFDLRELGWTSELADNLEPGLVPGRVAAAHRAAFDVWTETGAVRSRLPGRLMHEGLDVAVGDWVGLSLEASPAKPATLGGKPRAAGGGPVADGLVRSVLPRRSAIVRNAASDQHRRTSGQTLAANVDIAFVVSSLGPDLEPRRIERYLVTIWESGASPEIVLTKADRLDDPWELAAEVESVAIGVPVHVVSAVTGDGCDALRARIDAGTTAVLLGSSGVGKSTLVNLWLGEEVMVTRETREDDEGRHTTTHRQLLELPGGGLVIDTPGLRELQLWDVGSEALDATFADVEELAADCRFADCTHAHEPGCAVLAAVETGELPHERLHSWRKLQRELHTIALRHDAVLRKEELRKRKVRAREGRSRARLR
ncbi:MAG TPA: ribosome small subunit-dependent GTPase A [Gaiellaceae bacterium]|nr:ribosome small subunit-dependent GTPase A [Gaiellaceae bacterium]